MVELRWPQELDADVDLWVQAPGDVPVGYSNKGGRVFNLLRDDLWHRGDVTGLNHEIAYSRGIPAGEYTVSLHLFRNTGAYPVPTVVAISLKARPDGPLVPGSLHRLARPRRSRSPLSWWPAPMAAWSSSWAPRPVPPRVDSTPGLGRPGPGVAGRGAGRDLSVAAVGAQGLRPAMEPGSGHGASRGHGRGAGHPSAYAASLGRRGRTHQTPVLCGTAAGLATQGHRLTVSWIILIYAKSMLPI